MLIVNNRYIYEGKETLLLSSRHLKSITWNCPKERRKHLPVTQAGTRGEIAHLQTFKTIVLRFILAPYNIIT